MKATVAILEDSDDRRAAMRAAFEGGATLELVLFASAHEMIAWLGAHLAECAVLSLDHDLVVPGGPDPGSGLDVVLLLCDREPVCPVIVHTSDAVAASGMTLMLEQAGWRPERVVPVNDCEWIAAAWAPTVRALAFP